MVFRFDLGTNAICKQASSVFGYLVSFLEMGLARCFSK